jgi:hypothetical protein
MEFKLYHIQTVDNTLCYDNVDNYDMFRLNFFLLNMQMNWMLSLPFKKVKWILKTDENNILLQNKIF